MPSKYWEDFDVGFSFRTASITVTETHLVNWACLTMDFYPLHMDKEYSAKTVFKERIVHGPLIFGMAVGMVGMTGVAEDAVMAWLGADNMRMIAPVKIGDTITVEIEVMEKRETSKPSQGVQTWQYKIFNQRNELVMGLNMKFLMHRRAGNGVQL